MVKRTSIVDISGRVLARNTIIEVERGDFVVITVRYRYPKQLGKPKQRMAERVRTPAEVADLSRSPIGPAYMAPDIPCSW